MLCCSYRCGDFYELFFDDAATAANELDLVLTSRDKSSDNPVPMAGVPHHAAINYINRLLEKGHKVAVCEQLEDPKAAKGMVRRGIVRIVTPGTTLNSESLEAEANNYLAAIWLESARPGESVGLAVLDLLHRGIPPDAGVGGGRVANRVGPFAADRSHLAGIPQEKRNRSPLVYVGTTLLSQLGRGRGVRPGTGREPA